MKKMTTIKQYQFKIDDIIISIDVEIVSNEQVIIPLYKKNNDVILGMSSMTPISEFEKDIRSLLPKTLKGDLFLESMKSLYSSIQNHINKYGQLLPSDMDLYIGEFILIASAVTKALNVTVPDEREKYQIFSMVTQQLLNSLRK
jgi:hypothetical protein